MIDSIGGVSNPSLMDAVRSITQTQRAMETGSTGRISVDNTTVKGPSFTDMLGQLVKNTADAQKTADIETQKVLTGESTNIHQAVLSTQEAGVAFTLMTEVRNKLVSAYQELMRTQV